MALIYQLASAAFYAAKMLIRSIPTKLLTFIVSVFSSQTKFIIAEESSFPYAFQAAEIYLRTKIDNNNNNQVIADTFENIPLRWRLICTKENNRRRFELTFPTKFTTLIADSYIPYFVATAEEKIVEISTSQYCNFNVQQSFDTLQMHEVVKQRTIKDLDLFVGGRDFYRKIGKPWKRNYLLIRGGAVRSSVIAAIANHIKFDVCRFPISDIYRNSNLKRILSFPSGVPILLFVDLDCGAEFGCSSQFTLSGMLNVINVLWSRCGDNRIIILAKDSVSNTARLNLDWMDAHIYLSKMIKMFKQKPLE